MAKYRRKILEHRSTNCLLTKQFLQRQFAKFIEGKAKFSTKLSPFMILINCPAERSGSNIKGIKMRARSLLGNLQSDLSLFEHLIYEILNVRDVEAFKAI